MNSYIINFSVYSFAMIGFLAAAVFVYKKTAGFALQNEKKQFLKVDNMLRLSPAKTLYVIKAGNEKFLIAGDAANTTMLSKLENTGAEEIPEENEPEVLNIKQPDVQPFNILGFIRAKALQSALQRAENLKKAAADTSCAGIDRG